MRALLSIRPEHVKNILNGSKKFEFRRKIFARHDVRVVVIYCTKPVGCVVAEFDLDKILVAKPDLLWKATSAQSGITRGYFDAYFKGCEKAYALCIGTVRKYPQPILPSAIFKDFTPPQSYMYIKSCDVVSDASQQLELL